MRKEENERKRLGFVGKFYCSLLLGIVGLKFSDLREGDGKEK